MNGGDLACRTRAHFLYHCMAYEEEDTCVSYEDEDTRMPYTCTLPVSLYGI